MMRGQKLSLPRLTEAEDKGGRAAGSNKQCRFFGGQGMRLIG